jgi:hypothetical protein
VPPTSGFERRPANRSCRHGVPLGEYPTKTKGVVAGQASYLRWIEVTAQLGVAVPARREA